MAGQADPKVGVALGGGAARGLTHIPFIEAMDEMGIRPHHIAGSSIGALLGSGWASGLSGKQLRELSFEYLGSMRAIMGRIWSTRLKSLAAVFRNSMTMQLDPLEVICSFIPDQLPQTFDQLDIPLSVVATDFNTWHQVVFHEGELRSAIAASIAIPSIFKPMVFCGRTLIDGSVVDPLPLDVAARGADILVGVDVNGSPADTQGKTDPSFLDVGLGSAQIMMHGLISHTLAAYPPDVYVRPQVKTFGALEFWRVREIVESGEQDKDMFKRQLETAMENVIAGRQKRP